MPFPAGGYEWAGAITQVFHGTTGHISIADRPLPVGRSGNGR